MQFATTIAADGTYDIDGDIHRFSVVEIYNDGPGVVYYGDVPRPDVILQCDGANNQLDYTGPAVAGEAGAYTDVKQGMVATGDGIVGSTVITSVRWKFFTTADEVTSAGDLITFSDPALSSSTGIPIEPQSEPVRFVSALGNGISQQGLRLLADASGATVRIRKKLN